MRPAWERWVRYGSARSAGEVTALAGEDCALSALGLARGEWEMLPEGTRRIAVARWVDGHELGARGRDVVEAEVAAVPAAGLLAYLAARANCGGGTAPTGTPGEAPAVTGEACALVALGRTRAAWEALGEESRRTLVARFIFDQQPAGEVTLEQVSAEVAGYPLGELLARVAVKAGCAPDGTPREPRRVDGTTGDGVTPGDGEGTPGGTPGGEGTGGTTSPGAPADDGPGVGTAAVAALLAWWAFG